MHTGSRLISENFTYRLLTAGEESAATFADIFPDYHPQDRVGVVSPRLEDGVAATGVALLALTTAFYDCLRAHSADFFDYPQHFAFVGATGAALHTRHGLLAADTPKVWDAWSWLDVWPEHKWLTTAPTAGHMLRRIFDFQINRLFWPRSLMSPPTADVVPATSAPPLPPYAWKMLRRSLKAVYLYDDLYDGAALGSGAQNSWGPDAGLDAAWIDVIAAPPIVQVVAESLQRLPVNSSLCLRADAPSAQRLACVDIGAFLAQLQAGGC